MYKLFYFFFKFSLFSDYEMTLDHMEYGKEFLRPMLPSDTVFISTLREPMSRLKSSLYFRSLYKSLENTDEDPVLKFLSMHEMYKDWWSFNHMHHFLNLPRKSVYNEDPVGYVKYFKQIEAEVPLMGIAEFYDASLIYIRRRLCWETKDIMYLRLKSADRGKKDLTVYNASVIAKHRQYNPVDYALYDYFNQSFHHKLRQEPSDFWAELHYFRFINKKVSEFCQDVLRNLEKDTYFIANLSRDSNFSISFEKNKWGDAFTIDRLDCAFMMINEDVFRNIHVVRQYPSVCSKLLHQYYYDVNELSYSISTQKVRLHPDFCRQGQVKNHVPIKVLGHHESYDWSSEVPRVGEWQQRVSMYSQGMLGATNNV